MIAIHDYPDPGWSCDDCDNPLPLDFDEGVKDKRVATICFSCLWERYTELLRSIPQPTIPMYRVGDKVIAPNGQPRMVTGMKWSHARWQKGVHQTWGWWLDTVDPNDTKCKGCGYESDYAPDDREVG